VNARWVERVVLGEVNEEMERASFIRGLLRTQQRSLPSEGVVLSRCSGAVLIKVVMQVLQLPLEALQSLPVWPRLRDGKYDLIGLGTSAALVARDALC
jgi:hypothetical protein